jgi:hypothetical protein
MSCQSAGQSPYYQNYHYIPSIPGEETIYRDGIEEIGSYGSRIFHIWTDWVLFRGTSQKGNHALENSNSRELVFIL